VEAPDRSSLDLLTIGLLVFFIALIVIVAVMLLLPVLTPETPRSG
jgi:energy-converting hydrogenase Eha subunit A